MGSEASSAGARAAAGGTGDEGVLGPEAVPTSSDFEGANKTPGNYFGDESPRRPPSAGSDLVMGLSECESFEAEEPDELGEGRNDATGKPDGPQKGNVDNGGASARLEWG